MLNIPETVKTLFQRDGVNKNFRVTFPNGELTDLTNSDIVQESVKFTESVCSQNTFRFGPTEASVIEFETVGVPNIYGYQIACYLEIDCTSLSAAELEEIEAGTWDGTYSSGMFAVPLGLFTVQSCPRNHEAMTHRRVTAYSISGGKIRQNPFETAKQALFMSGPTYTPSAFLLTMAEFAYSNPSFLEEQGFTRTALPEWHSGQVLPSYTNELTLKDTSDNDVTVSFGVSYYYAQGMRISSDQLLSVDMHGFDYSTALTNAIQIFEENNIDYALSGYDSWADLLEAAIGKWYRPCLRNASALGVYMYSTIDLTEFGDNFVFYPYRTVGGGDYVRITIPSSAYCTISGVTGVKNILRVTDRASFYSYTAPTVIDLRLAFDFTASKRFSSYVGYSFTSAFDTAEIVNGYLELMACFGAASRSGGYELRRLSDASPVAIAPGGYSSLWWDEYDVAPIGTVRYVYTDEAGEQQVVDYSIGDGASFYDMSDNTVLNMLNDPTQIEALIDAYFAPNVAAVNFVPIDLNMKGLPYIEAGDAIAVTAQDGTVCRSYVLRHEISGIQVLTDQVDSQGGTILEGVSE